MRGTGYSVCPSRKPSEIFHCWHDHFQKKGRKCSDKSRSRSFRQKTTSGALTRLQCFRRSSPSPPPFFFVNTNSHHKGSTWPRCLLCPVQWPWPCPADTPSTATVGLCNPAPTPVNGSPLSHNSHISQTVWVFSPRTPRTFAALTLYVHFGAIRRQNASLTTNDPLSVSGITLTRPELLHGLIWKRTINLTVCFEVLAPAKNQTGASNCAAIPECTFYFCSPNLYSASEERDEPCPSN